MSEVLIGLGQLGSGVGVRVRPTVRALAWGVLGLAATWVASTLAVSLAGELVLGLTRLGVVASAWVLVVHPQLDIFYFDARVSQLL